MSKKAAEPAVEPVAAPHDQAADTTLHILSALEDLFGGAEEFTKLPSREEPVCFYPAKVKHLSHIGGLIEAMLSGLDKSEFAALAKMVSKDQEDKINAGVSPYSLGTTETIKEALGNGPLGYKLIMGAQTTMVKLAPLFTNLSGEEFEELDMDEGLIVMYGVFARNYSFFSQRLLPVIVACFANLKARNG